MTKHQKSRPAEIVAVILDYTTEYGYPPSVREIMVRVGLASTSAVHYHLGKLEKAGLIRRDPLRARSYVVASSVTDSIACPVCGRAA